MSRHELLTALRTALRETHSGELPGFLGELERVRVEAVLALASPRPAEGVQRAPGRVLTVQEAANRLGRSRWWIYRHKETLPITRFQSGGFGFDEAALERWIKGRTEERPR